MATTGLTKAAQSDKTRRALLDAARSIFTAQGYVATSTEEIVRRAGLTRGALYYHFRDKADLFGAVFDEVGQEYIAALRADIMAAQGDAWQRLMLGVERFLDRLRDPSMRRIVYLDGPAVLDWSSSEQRREPAFALLREIFAPLMAAGLCTSGWLCCGVSSAGSGHRAPSVADRTRSNSAGAKCYECTR